MSAKQPFIALNPLRRSHGSEQYHVSYPSEKSALQVQQPNQLSVRDGPRQSIICDRVTQHACQGDSPLSDTVSDEEGFRDVLLANTNRESGLAIRRILWQDSDSGENLARYESILSCRSRPIVSFGQFAEAILCGCYCLLNIFRGVHG